MAGSRVCHFKLVLLGDSAVGKSCLVVRFVRDEFFEFQEPTIGGTDQLLVVLCFDLLQLGCIAVAYIYMIVCLLGCNECLQLHF